MWTFVTLSWDDLPSTPIVWYEGFMRSSCGCAVSRWLWAIWLEAGWNQAHRWTITIISRSDSVWPIAGVKPRWPGQAGVHCWSWLRRFALVVSKPWHYTLAWPNFGQLASCFREASNLYALLRSIWSHFPLILHKNECPQVGMIDVPMKRTFLWMTKIDVPWNFMEKAWHGTE